MAQLFMARMELSSHYYFVELITIIATKLLLIAPVTINNAK